MDANGVNRANDAIEAQAANALQGVICVFAAGSLRVPFTHAAVAFEALNAGVQIAFTFGASGLLRERIAAGESADLFASANMAHPQSLAAAGGWTAAQGFARNTLCALVRPGLRVTPETLVATLLDPAIKLGTSTPRSDPSGDYALQLFERVERTGAAPPGSARSLAAKALQLTGGPHAPKPCTDGRNVYGVLVASGQADVFLTYGTVANVVLAEEPTLQVIQIPAAINISAHYGLAVRSGAAAHAQRFADELLRGAGQAMLRAAGFLPV